MLLSKPGDLETYKGFIEELTGYNISILETYYRRNTNNMVEEFVKGEFYKTLRDKLSVINNDYKEEKKFELVDNEKSLKMDIKTFENMLKNVIDMTLYITMNGIQMEMSGNLDINGKIL